MAWVLRISAAAAAALLVTAFPNRMFAAEHLSLWYLRGHLYVVEDDFYAKENSMVYVGEKSVIVIGATWTPDTAKQLVTEIRKISDARITQLIDTNYHPDRAGGNAYFKAIGTEIVASEMTREDPAKIKSTQPRIRHDRGGALLSHTWARTDRSILGASPGKRRALMSAQSAGWAGGMLENNEALRSGTRPAVISQSPTSRNGCTSGGQQVHQFPQGKP